MSVLEKIGNFFGKFMALIILAVAALALFVPQSCLWIQVKWVNPLLMLVMFGMGLTLKIEDFALVFTRPKDIRYKIKIVVIYFFWRIEDG